jgi:hypothetical protein
MDRVKGEIPEKLLQSVVSTMEIDIVPETGPYFHSLHPGLSRVDFPWVEIKDKWFIFGGVDLLKRVFCKPVWEEPEISTP